jgi:hypothetical protein
MPGPWKLEFFEVAQGSVIGTVTFDGTNMTVEGALSGLVDGRSPEDVLETYDGWSNGYASSRLVGEKRPMPQGGTRIPTMAERDKAMTNFLETNRFQDRQTGEVYDPVAVPPDPNPDEEDEGGSTPSTTPRS